MNLPIKVLLDYKKEPFVPYIPVNYILVGDGDRTAQDLFDERYTKEEVDEIIKSLGTLQRLCGRVDTKEQLPEDPKPGDTWIVGTTGQNSSEWMYIGDQWEELGPFIDFSPYSTTEEMDAAIAKALDAAKSYTDTRITNLDNKFDVRINNLIQDVDEIVNTRLRVIDFNYETDRNNTEKIDIIYSAFKTGQRFALNVTKQSRISTSYTLNDLIIPVLGWEGHMSGEPYVRFRGAYKGIISAGNADTSSYYYERIDFSILKYNKDNGTYEYRFSDDSNITAFTQPYDAYYANSNNRKVLTTDNKYNFTPTLSSHPATKGYVDKAVEEGGGGPKLDELIEYLNRGTLTYVPWTDWGQYYSDPDKSLVSFEGHIPEDCVLNLEISMSNLIVIQPDPSKPETDTIWILSNNAEDMWMPTEIARYKFSLNESNKYAMSVISGTDEYVDYFDTTIEGKIIFNIFNLAEQLCVQSWSEGMYDVRPYLNGPYTEKGYEMCDLVYQLDEDKYPLLSKHLLLLEDNNLFKNLYGHKNQIPEGDEYILYDRGYRPEWGINQSKIDIRNIEYQIYPRGENPYGNQRLLGVGSFDGACILGNYSQMSYAFNQFDRVENMEDFCEIMRAPDLFNFTEADKAGTDFYQKKVTIGYIKWDNMPSKVTRSSKYPDYAEVTFSSSVTGPGTFNEYKSCGLYVGGTTEVDLTGPASFVHHQYGGQLFWKTNPYSSPKYKQLTGLSFIPNMNAEEEIKTMTGNSSTYLRYLNRAFYIGAPMIQAYNAAQYLDYGNATTTKAIPGTRDEPVLRGLPDKLYLDCSDYLNWYSTKQAYITGEDDNHDNLYTLMSFYIQANGRNSYVYVSLDYPYANESGDWAGSFVVRFYMDCYYMDSQTFLFKIDTSNSSVPHYNYDEGAIFGRLLPGTKLLEIDVKGMIGYVESLGYKPYRDYLNSSYIYLDGNALNVGTLEYDWSKYPIIANLEQRIKELENKIKEGE